MANWTTKVAFDDGISTEANERFVLHDREIDTPTLSPECYQSVRTLRLVATDQNPASTNTRRQHGDPLCINGSRRSDTLITLC